MTVQASEAMQVLDLRQAKGFQGPVVSRIWLPIPNELLHCDIWRFSGGSRFHRPERRDSGDRERQLKLRENGLDLQNATADG